MLAGIFGDVTERWTSGSWPWVETKHGRRVSAPCQKGYILGAMEAGEKCQGHTERWFYPLEERVRSRWSAGDR